MTERERMVFEEAAAASAQISQAANRVLQGEESLRDAFARISLPAVRDLAAAIADADDLRREFGDRDAFQKLVKDRLKKLDADLRAFAGAITTELRDDAKAAAKKALQD